jgi:hypothetical protein
MLGVLPGSIIETQVFDDEFQVGSVFGHQIALCLK